MTHGAFFWNASVSGDIYFTNFVENKTINEFFHFCKLFDSLKKNMAKRCFWPFRLCYRAFLHAKLKKVYNVYIVSAQ